ncbi:bifunctional DNA-formamidopyrimidine glycosylase/DNA-(apurinic or apyrimidinic site) lyase [Natroniella acetigena]|uniref:bifunctional DNA-formamidopyrimidine glycosylase/DNA-(apurinic or apyrimidinic site) lyase n=1 Tax=Natroniella acetigena TaxID=52004 RepID=UPI00200B51F2|nr:bifunctional DNA-formamidopyrimidine glycosylase/DNA-(apurinic or apyrimidinic site) lyase [Natroniella acetigena]MCK8828537.1 bifunctional DNA-formamidopyrimidine glycosylase/DNA-(apurinic or apyrimidinic site) lyase [Natroniella acetigena]
MPELPEVQTVVDTLQPLIIDQVITEVEVKNKKLIAKPEVDEFKEVLQGSRIEQVSRRGKYIIIELDNDYYLVTHLRMTGRFVYAEQDEPADKYDYILLKFAAGDQLRLGSKRKFTRTYLVNDLQEAGSLTKLGPEPLTAEFTVERFKEMIASRRGRIKPLLLNQRFLAGLGNIYVDESLYLSQIHPLRTADTLTESEIEKLYQAIRKVLSEGIEHRGTTKWDYVDASGQAGSYQNYLQVYDREGKECRRCGSSLQRIKVGGRSSYFCPDCQ